MKRFRRAFIKLIVSLIAVVSAAAVAAPAQDTAVKLIFAPEFVLSDSAIAAGIDGTVTVSLKIDKTGTVSNIDLRGGPIWPCGTSTDSEIKAVREAVRSNVREAKFAPATKNGKPIDADIVFDFAIGSLFRKSLKAEGSHNDPVSSRLVEVGRVEGRAIHLAQPAYSRIGGVAMVRVLLDEQGRVHSAGTVRGNPALHETSRRAACDSRFSPTVLKGQPVKVTGVITYDFIGARRPY